MPFKSHTHIGVPAGNAIIWRYMGLDKFLDLIAHSRLFFTNVHSLPDKYEASLPADLALRHSELMRREHAGELDETERLLLNKMNRALRASTMVNCWSLVANESYALWKVYLGGAQAGVAIRSNLYKLRRAIEQGGDLDNLDIYIGRVQYTEDTEEMDEDFISEFSLVTMKRDFYAYEDELRLFILNPQDQEGETLAASATSPGDLAAPSSTILPAASPNLGRYVRVNVPSMVTKLYLSPFMGGWFKDAVVKILEQVQPALVSRIETSRILEENIVV